MDTNLNTAGYDLYEVSEDSWALHVKDGPIFVGTFRKVALHAVTRLGFKLEEIEYAAKEMIKREHNGAHFGMYRGFIFTFQREFKHVKQAS
jgi:hypothetical protein